jgi:hypothetical protein
VAEQCLGALKRPLHARPMRVALPFEARPRRDWLAAFYILVIALAGLFFALGGIAALVGAFRSLPPSGTSLLAGVAGVAMSVIPLGGVFLYFKDAANGAPVLRVDNEGFYSSRVAGEPIPWSAVSHAEVVNMLDLTYPAVCMTLRRRIKARRNFLRFGAWRNLYSRSEDQIYVPVIDLTHKRFRPSRRTGKLDRHSGPPDASLAGSMSP